MSHRIVALIAVSVSLVACAGRQSPQTQADAQTAADLQAAYACAANVLTTAGYPVQKDDRQLRITGWIREELPAGELHARGGVVAGGDRDHPMPAAPYEIDAVVATVSLDRATRDVKIDASAYTGVGTYANSGFSKRDASVRGASTVKKLDACRG